MRARRRPDLPSTNPTTTHVGDSPPCPLPLIANAIANAIAHACGSSIVLTRPRHHRGAASTFAASRHRCHHRCLLRQIVVTYVRNFTGWLLALAPWRHGGWRHFVLPSAIPRAAPPALPAHQRHPAGTICSSIIQLVAGRLAIHKPHHHPRGGFSPVSSPPNPRTKTPSFRPRFSPLLPRVRALETPYNTRCFHFVYCSYCSILSTNPHTGHRNNSQNQPEHPQH